MQNLTSIWIFWKSASALFYYDYLINNDENYCHCKRRAEDPHYFVGGHSVNHSICNPRYAKEQNIVFDRNHQCKIIDAVVSDVITISTEIVLVYNLKIDFIRLPSRTTGWCEMIRPKFSHPSKNVLEWKECFLQNSQACVFQNEGNKQVKGICRTRNQMYKIFQPKKYEF